MNLDTKRVPKHRPGNHAVPAGPLAPAMHTTQHGACHVDRDPAIEVLTLVAEFRLNEVRHHLSHSAMILQGFTTLSAQPVSARFAAPFNKRFLTSRCQLCSGRRHSASSPNWVMGGMTESHHNKDMNPTAWYARILIPTWICLLTACSRTEKWLRLSEQFYPKR